MHATSNARAMIVQYWIGIPNRVNSLAKNSTNSSISQSYITLLITAIPRHSSLKDEGRQLRRPLPLGSDHPINHCRKRQMSCRSPSAPEDSLYLYHGAFEERSRWHSGRRLCSRLLA